MQQIICGNTMDVLNREDLGQFDAVITDPPYAGGNSLADKQQATAMKYTGTKRNCPLPDFAGDGMDQRAWTHMMRRVFEAARKHCMPGAVIAVFIDWRNLGALTDALQWAGWLLRGVAVWDKVTSRPQRGRFRQQAEFIVWGSNGALSVQREVPCLPGVFRGTNVQGIERIHQTQKPMEVMREVVKICIPGGRILDPFAGSGTTLAAAEAEGHNGVGIEVLPAIAEAAAQRLGVGVRK